MVRVWADARSFLPCSLVRWIPATSLRALAAATLSVADAQSPWTPVPPRLGIVATGNTVTVSWRITPFEYVLESNDHFPPLEPWKTVSAAQDVLDDEIT